MRALVLLALMAGPAGAACFRGQPAQVTYSDGLVMHVLARKGDDVTYGWGDDPVEMTSHLMLFHLSTNEGGEVRQDTWRGRLPKAADLVPGFAFDIKGTAPAANGGDTSMGLRGEVGPGETLLVGHCAYEVTVITYDYSLNGEFLYRAKAYLRTDMMVPLRTEVQPAGAEEIIRTATALE